MKRTYFFEVFQEAQKILYLFFSVMATSFRHRKFKQFFKNFKKLKLKLIQDIGSFKFDFWKKTDFNMFYNYNYGFGNQAWTNYSLKITS